MTEQRPSEQILRFAQAYKSVLLSGPTKQLRAIAEDVAKAERESKRLLDAIVGYSKAKRDLPRSTEETDRRYREARGEPDRIADL